MPTKEEVAEKLINWHFQIEPDITEVHRFISPDEDAPQEPIKLLEVSAATLASGSVMAFGFGKTKEMPYSTVIATITPEEMEQVRRQEITLPHGWNLANATQYPRPQRTRHFRKTLRDAWRR